MEYVRTKLLRAKKQYGDVGEKSPYKNSQEKTIVIKPGQVEEAEHRVSVPGRISLEELRFWAYVPDPHEYYDSQNIILDKNQPTEEELSEKQNHPTNEQNTHKQRQTQDSYIDIVVFEIPIHCSSSGKPCPLPSFGIGNIVEDHPENGIPNSYLSLCDDSTGRLIVDEEVFHGYHTALHIPPSGYLMKDRITDPRAHKIPSFPSLDSKYEVLIANCDTQVYGTGRNIELSGQVLFESDPSFVENSQQPSLFLSGHADTPNHYHVGTQHQQEEYGSQNMFDAVSQAKLAGVGVGICLFFSLVSFRIHFGTRTDYFMARLEERNRNANTSSGGES